MIKLNIHEAKTHLSRHLEQLQKGETILLCKRNEPIAEIRPLPGKALRNRPLGLAKDQLTIPDEFFDPLPKEVIEAFYQTSS
ncbi:MAG: antitoxin [Nitrospirales bacterium]|nr:MAG: antitoxin [Nitrospirales bacterium]